MRKASKTLLTAIILSICISGCGKEKQETVTQTNEEPNVSNQVQEEIEINGSASYEATDEIKKADPYEGYVQIKDEVVQLPASYKELKEKLDFTLVSGENIRSEDYLVDGGDFFSIIVSLDDFGNQVEFYLRNLSEERISLKECQVQEISEFSANSVFFPGGITLGSSMEEVEAVLGECYTEEEHSDSLEYKYNIMITDKTIPFFTEPGASSKLLEKIPCNNYLYRITFDRNNATVSSIDCIFEENIVKEHVEYTLSKGSEYPISCQKPSGLQRATNSKRERFTGVLSIDDKEYFMVLSGEMDDFARSLPEIYEQYETIKNEFLVNYTGEHRYTTEEFSTCLLLPEEHKILTDIDTHITGISYSTNEDHISAHLVHDMYVENGMENLLRDYVAFLYPVEGSEISENAVAEFKEIVEHIGTSMMMEPQE